MKLVAFDLEIAKPIVDGVDWSEQRPLGISCASTLTSDGQLRLWHDGQNGTTNQGGVCYGNQMSLDQVYQLVAYLEGFIGRGYHVVTWNGLGFDFDILAEECQSRTLARRVADMAMGAHIDPGFQMVCQRGFMIGLQKCADGLRVAGKTEGMHGDLAPLLWSGNLDTASIEQKENMMAVLNGDLALAGTRKAQDLCLEYVGQDAKATMAVYNELVRQKEVWWITAKGTICRTPWKPNIKQDPYDRLLTVEEAMRLDVPNTSWMTDPRPRSQYIEWVKVLKKKRHISL